MIPYTLPITLSRRLFGSAVLWVQRRLVGGQGTSSPKSTTIEQYPYAYQLSLEVLFTASDEAQLRIFIFILMNHYVFQEKDCQRHARFFQHWPSVGLAARRGSSFRFAMPTVFTLRALRCGWPKRQHPFADPRRRSTESADYQPATDVFANVALGLTGWSSTAPTEPRALAATDPRRWSGRVKTR